MDAGDRSKEDLDGLRARVSTEQRQILSAIWRYYREHWARSTGGWIPERVLYAQFGHRKTRVWAALRQPPMSGSVVFEQGNGHSRSFQLTLLGVLLTDDEPDLEDNLIGYLTYIVDRCRADPSLDRVTNVEIQQALGLSRDQLGSLYAVLRSTFSRFGDTDGGSEETWQAVVPQNISDLLETDDLQTYVRRSILENYDPELPVDEQGGRDYSTQVIRRDQAISDLWFIQNAALRGLLASDWLEARTIYPSCAHKSCVILCGGILEGLLLDAHLHDKQRASTAFEQKYGKNSPQLERWSLQQLVEIGKELGLFSDPTLLPLSDVVRQWRDLVHPGRQVRTALTVTSEKAAIAINAVSICIHDLDLAARADGRQPTT